jgi:hypothetical protein
MGATSSSCSLNNSSSGDDPSFVTDLTLQDRDGNNTTVFVRDEPITMILTVRNRLNTPATIQFTDGRQEDFVVVRENSSSIVWQWSQGQTFSTTASELSFAAGETQTFTRIWDQQDNNGNSVRAGTYEARGALVYTNFDSAPLKSNQQGSTLVRFTIN